MQRGRARPLGRRQQAVARAQREPVALAHRGTAHDAGVEEESVHEALDEPQLLEVLLAEVRALGSCKQQELQHDRQHAVEMTRPRGALECQRKLVLGHAIAIAVAVDLVRARHEYQVAAGIPHHCEIPFGRARIALEVAGIVELRGIDENAGPCTRILRLRAPQQRHVPLVQRAERRHEARRAGAARAPVLDEFRDALDDLHAS